MTDSTEIKKIHFEMIKVNILICDRDKILK